MAQSEEQLKALGDAIREQNQNQGSAMTELVFDPMTGEFKQVPKGTATGPGQVVTEMTDKGFAF